MSKLKTTQDIERLAEGGAILARVLDELVREAVPGAIPSELDALAQQRIAEAGCTPAFLNYAPGGHTPFPAALCLSVNEAVVHGLPGATPLKSGDVVGLDLGLVYQDRYYLDSACTVGVGEVTDEAKKLMAVTKEALRLGIAAAQPGNRIGDIGAAVQQYVESEGFGVVHQLVGHGVGFAVHEEPKVPNFGKAGTGPVIKPGLVIAIEPMVTVGDPEVDTHSDGWSIVVKGGGLAAHDEHTVAITEQGPRILTQSAQ